jgi:uncharacterized protein YqgQ
MGSSVMESFPLRQISKAWPGLKSLRKNFYSKLFQNEIVDNEEKHDYIKNHLVVVRSFREKTSDVSWIMRPSHFIMKRAGSVTDGLVSFQEQMIPNAKYEEKVMEMDHSDLFTSGILSGMTSDFRKNMMVSLINGSF